MAGTRGERAALPPPCHPGIDQFRVARQAILRAEAQSFHDAGAETFEHDICVVGQPLYQLLRIRVLEIDAQGFFPPIGDGLAPPAKQLRGEGAAGTLQQGDVRAHVGEQHAAKGAGADAGEFDDLDAGQRAVLSGLCVCFFHDVSRGLRGEVSWSNVKGLF
ncbi:hypothetical protein SDC9_158550 [bioreactor metagenome]|uniref:Uncharacterized protein n=1 Tax=bioreactor metagenome TaxID=1076179 RepID=A0A645FD11_9ZZZZ